VEDHQQDFLCGTEGETVVIIAIDVIFCEPLVGELESIKKNALAYRKLTIDSTDSDAVEKYGLVSMKLKENGQLIYRVHLVGERPRFRF
jgi:hypothetical protein